MTSTSHDASHIPGHGGPARPLESPGPMARCGQRAFDELMAVDARLVTTPLVLLECGNAAARHPFRQLVVQLREELRAAGHPKAPAQPMPATGRIRQTTLSSVIRLHRKCCVPWLRRLVSPRCSPPLAAPPKQCCVPRPPASSLHRPSRPPLEMTSHLATGVTVHLAIRALALPSVRANGSWRHFRYYALRCRPIIAPRAWVGPREQPSSPHTSGSRNPHGWQGQSTDFFSL